MSMMLICALPTVGELYSTLHQSDLEILEAFESAKQYCFAFASGGTDGKGQSGSDTLCVILDKLAAQARIGGWHDGSISGHKGRCTQLQCTATCPWRLADGEMCKPAGDLVV